MIAFCLMRVCGLLRYVFFILSRVASLSASRLWPSSFILFVKNSLNFLRSVIVLSCSFISALVLASERFVLVIVLAHLSLKNFYASFWIRSSLLYTKSSPLKSSPFPSKSSFNKPEDNIYIFTWSGANLIFSKFSIIIMCLAKICLDFSCLLLLA